MIIKLICFLWGHSVVHKAATGEQYDTIDRLTGAPTKGTYYVWRQNKFCVRCGKPNQYYTEENKNEIRKNT